MNRQESHRIYLQLFAPDNNDGARGAPDGGYATLQWQGSRHPENSAATTRSNNRNAPSSRGDERRSPNLMTTSAAVRLTDRATTRDVTALLRGKFGLPQITNNRTQRDYPSTNHRPTTVVPPPTRGGESNDATDAIEASGENDEGDEVDALVLIATMDRPPKGYLRFEHEGGSHEENRRLENIHRLLLLQRREERRCRGPSEMTLGRDAPPITETDFVGKRELDDSTALSYSSPPSDKTKPARACGAPGGWSSSMPLSSLSMQSASASVVDANTNERRRLTTLVSELSVSTHRSPPIVDRALSPPQSRPGAPNPSHEFDLEPIHVVRTVLPDEHPLLVRDEAMAFLIKLRRKAQDEMGCRLMDGNEGGNHGETPQPTFRWYFQPCSPLGRNGSVSSPKIQCIPAFVDVEGYCTEDESESDHDESRDLESDDVGEDSMDVPSDAEKETQHSRMRRQLFKERRRIACLSDLTDPPFIVSGYLLRQSWRDPNVWKRVYCVLSEDRMWTIGRMKPLTSFGRASVDEILSFLRTGRHRYFMLHRSQLGDKGEGSLIRQYSSSKYSGYYLTPLNQRLPNTFRVITSQGKCHTFRAFTSRLFRLWVTSISNRIAQKFGDGIIDLANVIAEEETMARCRRMDGVAVSPLELNDHSSTESKSISMDVVRFGISVAEFSELCRHVNDATRQYSAFNAETRYMNAEYEVMISSVWDEARVVTSKSAQLIHALAKLQYDDSDMKIHHSAMMRELVEEQKNLQALLGEQFDHQENMVGMAIGVSSLPTVQIFGPLLHKIQVALVRINDSIVTI